MNFKDQLIHYGSLLLSAVVFIVLLSSVLWSTTGDAFNPPNGQLFWLLTLFVAALIGGQITEFIRAPPLLGMLIAGFVLRNTTSMSIDADVSSVLRNIALTVILLRAGFGLDPKALAKLSAVCFRLSFTPCLIETLIAAITTHFIVGLPWEWGFLLGFVIAAVSPAVVVPGLISLSERKYGTDKGVPTLIIAAASVDDVLAITGFGVLLGVVFSHKTSLVWQILKGPVEAIVGLVMGAVIGLFLWFIPQQQTLNVIKSNSSFPMSVNQQRLLLSLFFALAVVFLSRHFEWSGVGPLGALTLAFVAALKWRKNKCDMYIEAGLKFIWYFCQPFLFALIGAEVRLSSLDTSIIGWCLLCLVICLIFRCIASGLVIWGAELNWKEKLFVALSWLPKATVQAAFGPVALDLARREEHKGQIAYAEIILNIAVLSIIVTAPLGALLIAVSGPRLLNKENDDDNVKCGVVVDNIDIKVTDCEKQDTLSFKTGNGSVVNAEKCNAEVTSF